jgi:hypothetical protein
MQKKATTFVVHMNNEGGEFTPILLDSFTSYLTRALS